MNRKGVGGGVRVLAGAVMGLLVVMVFNTVMVTSRQKTFAPVALPAVDVPRLTRALSQAVAARTVSHQDPADNDWSQWDLLHAHLQLQFPRTFATLQRENVAQRSLLFTWLGTNPALPPLVLMAHQDVVPVEDKTLPQWEHPPFSGAVVDGMVWGRGTLDDKVGLITTLTAVELLLEQGFRPTRTVILAFGHDEESQSQGATAMAALLKARGVTPWLVMDEGLVTTVGMMPGVSRPVAMVGVAQKGYATVELKVTSQGGHSSMPPAATPVGILGRAVAALELHQMPARAGGVAHEMLEWVTADVPLHLRLVFANLWLLRPVVRQLLLRKPQSAAVLRTTTAPTMLEASPKENILPSSARAVVNFRLIPGDTVQDVLAHIATTVGDPRVEVNVLPGAHESKQPTSTQSAQFSAVHQAIGEVDPDVLVAPGLVTGATDARQFLGHAQAILLYRPVRLTQPDVARIHGVNERIVVADLERCVRFEVRLIQLASQVSQATN
jgi:carboxypeptidase PM20D1